MNDQEKLDVARRLSTLGVQIKSPELLELHERTEHFKTNGNRELRRRAKRQSRKRGK